MPLVKTVNIADTLKTQLFNASTDLEVFTEFPSDEGATSEGIYVARFYQESRAAKILTLGTSGSTYEVVDRLEMYLIQGQLNPHVDEYLDVVSNIIDNEIFVEYFKREYTVEQVYRKNAENYRIIFSLTRLQIIS